MKKNENVILDFGDRKVPPSTQAGQSTPSLPLPPEFFQICGFVDSLTLRVVAVGPIFFIFFYFLALNPFEVLNSHDIVFDVGPWQKNDHGRNPGKKT